MLLWLVIEKKNGVYILYWYKDFLRVSSKLGIREGSIGKVGRNSNIDLIIR